MREGGGWIPIVLQYVTEANIGYRDGVIVALSLARGGRHEHRLLIFSSKMRSHALRPSEPISVTASTAVRSPRYYGRRLNDPAKIAGAYRRVPARSTEMHSMMASRNNRSGGSTTAFAISSIAPVSGDFARAVFVCKYFSYSFYELRICPPKI